MPSGLRKTSSNHFEIYYEKPWGGVASDADATDIQDNQLIIAQGVIDVDGVLCEANTVASASVFRFTPHTAKGTLNVIFNLTAPSTGETNLYGVDTFGDSYIYQASTGTWVYLNSASDGPWAITDRASAVEIINGVAYIASFSRKSIYGFGVGYGTIVTFITNYTGGLIMGVLDDYLLQMNTNSTVDGIQPTRFNWSGPGKFTTWDPAIDRTAGFNTLAAADDYISGFISLASVGLIITKKGIIQASPTGIGIGPFSFEALWTSDVGQGTSYPYTVVQYGQVAYLVSDTGVYRLSTSGFQEVSGAARKAILSQVQVNSLFWTNSTDPEPPKLAGGLYLYSLNSTYPTPYYVFAATTPTNSVNPFSQLILWFLNLATGTWYSQEYSVDALINAQNGTGLSNGIVTNLNIVCVESIDSTPQFGQILPNILIFATVSYNFGAEILGFVATTFITTDITQITDLDPGSQLALTFKQHEIKLGRQPTIRRVVVKAFGSGTLNISVSGVNFGSIVLDGTTVPKTYLTTQGIYTGEDPQLSITSDSWKGCITKVMLAGTYADGDID